MRYYLDTNCLIGFTFAHDVWCPEAERIFSTENSLYTGEKPLYEYCNKNGKNAGGEVSWELRDGVYGRIRGNLRMNKVLVDQQLQMYADEELDVETVVAEFNEGFDIEEEAEPRIRRYFEEKLDKEVTREAAREAVRDLVDTILNVSQKRKDELRAYLTVATRNTDYPRLKNRLNDYLHRSDIEVLCDAYHLYQQDVLEQVITADMGIYESRDVVDTILGLNVQYIKDEVEAPEEKLQ
jgi:hypothetical protein